MNYAILLAGGTGTRISGDVPKQYVRAGGYMMVTYALKPLIECDHIDSICIVAEHEWREFIAADLESAGLNTEKICAYAIPGTNRQTSILNGIQEIIRTVSGVVDVEVMGEDDTVMIHDAARPFLTAELIDRCYGALNGHDGVMPALPMKDTVYHSKDGVKVAGLLDRETIFAGQAPELFSLKAYYRANMALMPERIHRVNGASEPAVMAGMDIIMLPGDEDNFKVTTDADMARFKNTKEM